LKGMYGTGLRRLREEFSRSVRHGVPVSGIMVDIDHFKQFNDSFGHDAGDAVLRMVSNIMVSTCRYCGEEFLIVAPGTGLNDVATLAERIRRIAETSKQK